VLGLGGWAATTEFAGAVIAPGQLVVSSNVKKVQHPTGGVIGELLVQEGDRVHARASRASCVIAISRRRRPFTGRSFIVDAGTFLPSLGGNFSSHNVPVLTLSPLVL
jgi:hypothetical protein